jgi:enoyl-CoA hydratase
MLPSDHKHAASRLQSRRLSHARWRVAALRCRPYSRGMLQTNEEILTERRGGLVIVTLNRPKALNALSPGMCRTLAAALPAWEADRGVRAILIRGAGGRAFCAGGDVRAIREAQSTGDATAFGSAFFRDEYRLNRHIARLSKPWIALLDGITMGGGAGVSVNGAYRVATERTMLAMPESGIGLFPDVGATRFLNLCPGRIGRYLGLSGARVGAADALYCGFATHYVPRERVAPLIAALAGSGGVEETLAGFAADPGPAPIAARQPAIDRCFAADNIEAILDALEREATEAEWAAGIRAGLLTKSPTSLKITLRQLSTGRDFAIEEALALEYRLTQHVMAGHDFYEGVRAVLVDKDQQPRWDPPTLAGVDEAMVDSYFAPLGEAELRFD